MIKKFFKKETNGIPTAKELRKMQDSVLKGLLESKLKEERAKADLVYNDILNGIKEMFDKQDCQESVTAFIATDTEVSLELKERLYSDLIPLGYTVEFTDSNSTVNGYKKYNITIMW